MDYTTRVTRRNQKTATKMKSALQSCLLSISDLLYLSWILLPFLTCHVTAREKLRESHSVLLINICLIDQNG